MLNSELQLVGSIYSIYPDDTNASEGRLLLEISTGNIYQRTPTTTAQPMFEKVSYIGQFTMTAYTLYLILLKEKTLLQTFGRTI